MRCDRYPFRGGGVGGTSFLARIVTRGLALLTTKAMVAFADTTGPGTSGVVVPGGAAGGGGKPLGSMGPTSAMFTSQPGERGPLGVVTLTLSNSPQSGEDSKFAVTLPACADTGEQRHADKAADNPRQGHAAKRNE